MNRAELSPNYSIPYQPLEKVTLKEDDAGRCVVCGVWIQCCDAGRCVVVCGVWIQCCDGALVMVLWWKRCSA